MGRKRGKGRSQTQGSGNAQYQFTDYDQQPSNEEIARQHMMKNALLRFEGIDPTKTSIKDIKSFFKPFGKLGWVEYDKSDTKGYLRFNEPNSATPALEKAREAGGGKIVLNDKELTVRVVEGEEEFIYWTKMFEEIEKKNIQKMKMGSRREKRQMRQWNQSAGWKNRGGPQGKRKNDNGEKKNGGGNKSRSAEPLVKAAKFVAPKSEEATPEKEVKAE